MASDMMRTVRGALALFVVLCGVVASANADTSTVTVYGRINATLESIEAKPGPGGGIGGRTRLSDSYSFVGIRASEDLGGGTSAYFFLQSAFDISGQSTPFAVNNTFCSDQCAV